MYEDVNEADEERMGAFDLVTEALGKIDAYQQSRASNESSQQRLLMNAEKDLGDAVAKDSNYFKAKYLQAMVAYLRGAQAENKPPSSPESASPNPQAQAAVTQFAELQTSIGELNHEGASRFSDLEESGKKLLISNELNYNHAAAVFQGGENRFDAIPLFETTAEKSKDDPEVQLLSLAGAVLARATRLRQTPNPENKDEETIENHKATIRKELRPFSFPKLVPLVRRLLRKKRIDKEVADEVRDIIKHAENVPGKVSPPDQRESDKPVLAPT